MYVSEERERSVEAMPGQQVYGDGVIVCVMRRLGRGACVCVNYWR